MKLLVSALEASANLHLEPVLQALGEVELCGIFDPRFGAPYLPSSAFSVMGFLDVVPKIALAKRAMKALVALAGEVGHVLLIDSPAFNLPLAKAIKEAHPHVQITYYILPQVWAWKAGRAAKVEAYCDNLASILPFERTWYPKAKFVGHPLLDEIEEVKTTLTCNEKVAFLPGSRPKEIARLMPIFKEVAKSLDKETLLVIPPFIEPKRIGELYGDITGFTPVFHTHKALLQSDFAFVCSGTATLEAALVGVPFVLAYRAHWLDFAIAKRFVKLPYVGLANVILHFMGKEALHEELLQDEVCASALLEAYHRMDGARFFAHSRLLAKLLGHGSAQSVAQMIQPEGKIDAV